MDNYPNADYAIQVLIHLVAISGGLFAAIVYFKELNRME